MDSELTNDALLPIPDRRFLIGGRSGEDKVIWLPLYAVLLAGALTLNLVLVLLEPRLFVSTVVLIGTIGVALVVTFQSNRTVTIPPLLDIAFLAGAFAYFILPALLSLIFSYNAVDTLPLQQGLIGVTIGVFTLVRYLTGWRSWERIVAGAVGQPSDEEQRSLRVLLALTACWVVVAAFFSVEYFLTPYGTRDPGQRNPLTIILLGFDYFGVCLTSFFILKVCRDVSKRWMALGVTVMIAYSVLCLFVFGLRTKFLWGLALAGTIYLIRYRLTLPRLLLSGAGLLVFIPFLVFTSRARTDMHTLDWSVLNESFADTLSLRVAEMAEDTELAQVSAHADRIIVTFGDDAIYGKYVGAAILQSPPAIVLRLFGFEEVQSLAVEYLHYYKPGLFESGGGLALALSAESFCNFGRLGGLFSGVVLAVFCILFEYAAFVLTSPWLGLPAVTTFAIAVARVNRGGLESAPKFFVALLVLMVLYKIISLIRFRTSHSHAGYLPSS